MVIQANKNEFYIVGANVRFYLRPIPTLDTMEAFVFVGDDTVKTFTFLASVDEGHFDKKGEFVADRKRNGDEIGHRGLWVEPDINVLRVITVE
jgi:hypothetical protein